MGQPWENDPLAEDVQSPDEPQAWSSDEIIDRGYPGSTGNKGIVGAGQWTQKALLDLILTPVSLVNAGLWLGTTGVSDPRDEVEAPRSDAADVWRQKGYEMGMTPHPDAVPEGPVQMAAEVFGAGIAPNALFMNYGKRLLSQSILQMERMGVLQKLSTVAAARPMATVGSEVLSSVGMGTARAAAESQDASPQVTLMAELFGAFAPQAFLYGGYHMSMLRVVKNSIAKHLLPFTKAGAWPRASARLKEVSQLDPKVAAANIDPNVPISAARQSQDAGLLGLEKKILAKNPEMQTDIDKTLEKARDELVNEALMFGGEKGRVKKLLIQAKQYLFNLVDMRSAKAAVDAEAAMSKLDPDATARDINRAARGAVEDAYTDVRAQETELWGALDSAAPVQLTNARNVYGDIMSTRSRFDPADDIPKWLQDALRPSEIDTRTMSYLRAQGLIDKDGVILPAAREALEKEGIIKIESLTFNDARAIRKRLLHEIALERGAEVPNRDKIRILNKIANGDQEFGIKGLIDDISDSGVEGAKEAREFSLYLNERFTRGKVGKLLGFKKQGDKVVTDAETLDYLLTGRDPATTVNQLVAAAPVTRPMVENFLKEKFLNQATRDGLVNKKAANVFIDRWKRRGMFEVYPELEAELKAATDASVLSAKWNIRAAGQGTSGSVRNRANLTGKSRAQLYLNSDIDDEIKHVIDSTRPILAMRAVVKRVKGDKEALNGLRTQFLEEGFSRSGSGKFHDADGSPIYSGKKFTDYLYKNRGVAKELGLPEGSGAWKRLEQIALRMRHLELEPGKIPANIMEDKPQGIIDFVARIVGARFGAHYGSEMGSSLVMAGAGSTRMREIITKLTRSHAEKLLVDASMPTPEGARLYRALLMRPDWGPARQEKAATILEAWMLGVGITASTKALIEEPE